MVRMEMNFYAPAEAFRQITEDELTPIHPEVEEKRIVVNLDYQTLSCYEGNREVYFCLISSGSKFNSEGEVVEKWATPPGTHTPWRKTFQSICQVAQQAQDGIRQELDGLSFSIRMVLPFTQPSGIMILV